MMFKTGQSAIAILLVVSGCSLPASPTADVTDAQPGGAGSMAHRMAVTLCVTNPNPEALVFREVTVNLDLAGARLASGPDDDPIRLASLSSTRVPLTVLTVRNLGGQFIDAFGARSVSYRVHGLVALDGALGLHVPYSRSGRLDLTDVPGLAPSRADAGSSQCLESDIAVSL